MSDSIFTELKRRNVFKVSVAYLVLAWVVIQVTQAAVPALHLPEWINSAVFLFGLVGFPFAVFFAWVFEITPEGVKRESEIAPEDSISMHTGQKLNFIIIGLLVVALGYFIYESRFDSKSPITVVGENVVGENITTEGVTSKQQLEGSSIAVLPFVNMSSDPEQEYFSDGISEEILNVLAQIPNLHVTSRSSAFAFKGTKINISEVASKLGVKNVLEGSVRKSGNRIRITAQLIEAGSDKHLWSETYDRELTDIFAIQDEISTAIVTALKSKLGIETTINKNTIEAVNLDAYNEYLQGRFYIEKRKQLDLEKALSHFNKAIELSPDYAPAWMGKAWASLFLSEFQYGNIPHDVAVARALPAAEKALALDPGLAEAQAIMGLIQSGAQNEDVAISYYQKAIELNPNYADAYTWYASRMFEFPLKRRQLREKALQLSPMSLLANLNYGFSLVEFDRFDEAQKIAEHMLIIDENSFQAYNLLSYVNRAQGNLGMSSYFQHVSVELNQATNHKVILAFNLHNLGLSDQAAQLVKEAGFEEIGLLFNDNLELYLSQVRQKYPRSDPDVLGNFIRGDAEMLVEDYAAAIGYLENSFCDDCNQLIFAYGQVGEQQSAATLFDKRQKTLKSQLESGQTNLQVTSMEMAFLSGDNNKAVEYLQAAMERGYILDFGYQIMPMYQSLREHPEWPSIVDQSKKRQKEQGEIYL
ncbi:MAG: hypothetical protein COA74_08615 [Gammaproteobacteria bacterium]|nr:MAG: hypothetical protein COA74_08615 [Gammaproteobacteria bacterium]